MQAGQYTFFIFLFKASLTLEPAWIFINLIAAFIYYMIKTFETAKNSYTGCPNKMLTPFER